MKFYRHMKEVKITIDDYIPLKPGTNEPIFNRPSADGAWWMTVIEKAYAKFNVHYSNLNWGVPM